MRMTGTTIRETTGPVRAWTSRGGRTTSDPPAGSSQSVLPPDFDPEAWMAERGVADAGEEDPYYFG